VLGGAQHFVGKQEFIDKRNKNVSQKLPNKGNKNKE